MTDEMLHVLFVSTGNSGRSIMAEALLQKLGRKGFLAFSAGTAPNGSPNPLAVETLKQTGYETADLRSKSWEEFATIQAPRLDVVITLGEEKPRDRFPLWFSNPVIVHWYVHHVDDLDMNEVERQYAYRRFFAELEQQILKLSGLDLAAVRGHDLEMHLKNIAPKAP